MRLLDDFRNGDGRSRLGTRWDVVTDRVMGGVSSATLGFDVLDGEACLRLRGSLSLEHDGGFVQARLPLASDRGSLDVTDFNGLVLRVRGLPGRCFAALRTPACIRPWHSFRAPFEVELDWRDVVLPFKAFAAHRLEAALDRTRLRRLGLMILRRPGPVDLAVARVALAGDREDRP